MLLAVLWFSATVVANDSVTLELQSGDNWVGFGVLPEDPTIEETLSGVSQDVDFIMGEHHYASLIDGVWIRNFDHFQHTLGYNIHLNLSEPTEVEIIGNSTDPDILIPLHEGLNLVNFSCKEDVPVDEVIPDWAVASIRSVVGNGVRADLTNGSWTGTLTELRPGNSYWLDASGPLNDFWFVCPDGDGRSLHVYGCLDPFATNFDDYATVEDGSCEYDVPGNWKVNPYESRAFFFLHDVRVAGAPISPATDPVCVKQGQTCLGFGYTRDGWTGVTAYDGEENRPVSLSVYDATLAVELELPLDTPPVFQDGQVAFGGCTNPDAFNYNDVATFDIGNCVECYIDADCTTEPSVCTPTVCREFTCITEPLDCDDGDPCTEDNCVESDGCIHEALEPFECEEPEDDLGPADAATGCGCSGTPSRAHPWLIIVFAIVLRRAKIIPEYTV